MKSIFAEVGKPLRFLPQKNECYVMFYTIFPKQECTPEAVKKPQTKATRHKKV